MTNSEKMVGPCIHMQCAININVKSSKKLSVVQIILDSTLLRNATSEESSRYLDNPLLFLNDG